MFTAGADEHLGAFYSDFEGWTCNLPATDIAIHFSPPSGPIWSGLQFKCSNQSHDWLRVMERPTPSQLRKLVGVANYQFGLGVGSALFNRRIMIACSRRTGRIRHVYREGRLLATLRPKDGYLALTILGAKILLSRTERLPNVVTVQDDVSEAIESGGDVFAKHIAHADANLRPAEEVIVTDEQGHLLGVGTAVLSGADMMHFKRGVAVKLRRGTAKVQGAK